jgi:flavin reductase (DIM6/NTAB) family NADH-FMN oxidoreductase RutF
MICDARAWRSTMSLVPTSVAVLTLQAGETSHGMTASSFTSVSLDPLLVLFCVSRHAHMASLLRDAGGFTVNILRRDQEALSTYFAGAWQGASPPPFRLIPWPGGPRLEGAAAAIGCILHTVFEGGDHLIVVGKVVALTQGVEPIEPLLFYRGSYTRPASREGSPAPDLEAAEPVQIFHESWG